MKSAIIAPTGLLERYCTTGYHLALAHMMDNEEYVDFYKKTESVMDDFVILDNSVIELGEPVDFAWLKVACDRFQPDELILADFKKQPRTTYEWAEQYGPAFRKLYPSMQLMAVPHWPWIGDIEGWMKSLRQLVTLPFVDTIGIPKFLQERRTAICALIDLEMADLGSPLRRVNYHLLGTWGNPIEIVELTKYKWIRGVDSKIPVRLGQLGITLHPHRGLLGDIRYELPALNFDRSDDPLPIITQHNCTTYQNWAEGVLAKGGQELEGKVLPFERTGR